jgi:hypothetical protein
MQGTHKYPKTFVPRIYFRIDDMVLDRYCSCNGMRVGSTILIRVANTDGVVEFECRACYSSADCREKMVSAAFNRAMKLGGGACETLVDKSGIIARYEHWNVEYGVAVAISQLVML